MDASVVLTLGGLCAIAAVAVVKWVPRGAVARQSVLLDLVRDELFDDPAPADAPTSIGQPSIGQPSIGHASIGHTSIEHTSIGPVADDPRMPGAPAASMLPVRPVAFGDEYADDEGSPLAPAAPLPAGLPREQLDTWLGWVREDLDRIAARTDYLDGIRARLEDQERLLCELLRQSDALSRA